jgi:hypothetical protein
LPLIFIKYLDETIAIHGSAIWMDTAANPIFAVPKRPLTT